MMSIALRFIPMLILEADKIMKAQQARGADFESGNLIQRMKSLIPLLIPLFIGAFGSPRIWRWLWKRGATGGGRGTDETSRDEAAKMRRGAAAALILFAAAVIAEPYLFNMLLAMF